VFESLVDGVTAIATLNQHATGRTFSDPISLVKTEHTFAGIEPILKSHIIYFVANAPLAIVVSRPRAFN
jgi:hypothetical protein